MRLYYGVRSPDHLAFAAAIPQWEAAGVKVVPVFSESGKGYVQDVFAKVGDPAALCWVHGVRAVGWMSRTEG